MEFTNFTFGCDLTLQAVQCAGMVIVDSLQFLQDARHIWVNLLQDVLYNAVQFLRIALQDASLHY